jgi:hypothetical protein
VTAQRTIVTLEGLLRLHLQIRRCRNPDCPRHKVWLRPEAEGRFALPQHEFGLDVIVLVGRLRHAEHRSIPEIHAELVRRGVPICVRSVGNLLDRYDELLALALSDTERLRRITDGTGRVILAIDGLQPDVGQEVLWVFRDALSGEILLAKSLASSTRDDLAKLIGEVQQALSVPIIGVVSDGRDSIRKAVKKALDGVPHQLCHFHTVRAQSRTEAARRRPLRLDPLSTPWPGRVVGRTRTHGIRLQPAQRTDRPDAWDAPEGGYFDSRWTLPLAPDVPHDGSVAGSPR